MCLSLNFYFHHGKKFQRQYKVLYETQWPFLCSIPHSFSPQGAEALAAVFLQDSPDRVPRLCLWPHTASQGHIHGPGYGQTSPSPAPPGKR